MSKIESESSKPAFPLRKVSHEKRLESARVIASRAVDTYKDAVLAVCIYASTAKNLDVPIPISKYSAWSWIIWRSRTSAISTMV